ncbi:MAG: hypothetical protein KF729_18615, partial [Sandaracinaceae bacterium]|nr:hypothetical protein [Sandaracinaceae bacterium]
MRPLLFTLALAAAVGCGPAARPATPAAGGPALDEAGGVRLLAVPRPTAGRVWLSVWLDAGSRDATPAQLAALSALAIAPEGVEARALADGVELARECPADALAECLAPIGRALATRRVTPARLTAALASLRAARRAVAPDPERRADALALGALLGASADPMGDPQGDDGIDAAAIEGFLAAHFGRDRALVVAVGDVRLEALRAAASRAFADVP